jgi:hypothetical protein
LHVASVATSIALNGGFVAERPIVPVPLRPRTRFPRVTGNADDRIMKRLLLLLPAVVLAACGSSGSMPKTSSTAPMMYVSSSRSTADIASCLASRLSRVQTSGSNGATELTVGSSSHSSYFVMLTPSGHGSVIKVLHPDGSPEDPPEPEMRFDIARCAV